MFNSMKIVLIRVLALDYDVRIVEKLFKQIYIEDPSNSRIAQWTDSKTKQGLLDLEMLLSDEPNLGIWTIKVEDDSKSTISVSFEVKKYVLPKFEVTLDHFRRISIEDKTFNVSVCAKYSNFL